MNVLVVEPGMAPYEKEINGLREMQAVVGGLIQAIYPHKEQVAVVCNDEGLLMGLPFNRSMEGGYGGVFGTFFVCGTEAADFCSLTPEQVERYKKVYQNAEILLGCQGNRPITLQVQARQPRKDAKEPLHQKKR